MERGKLGAIAALVIGASMVWGGVAEAQQFSPRARPLFGNARLREGFMPDPHIMNGRMGGPINAGQVNSSCRGFISQQPSHVIMTPTGFRQLRLVVNAPSDATMMVMLPNGVVLCDDDGGHGMNPLIATTVARGRIAVWVGAYSQGNVGQPYTLGVTELPHITAQNLQGGGVVAPGNPGPPVVQPAPGGLQPNAPPSFGSANLRSGFMPDPHVLSGTAGGPVRGNSVGGQGTCRGYLSPNPNHVLNSPTGFRNLRFVVNASSDTTLVVMLPDGRILCDDDGGSGTNPLLQTAAPPGPIRVWVGTYSQSRAGQVAYNIGFSELSSVGTANIPPAGGGGVVARPPVVANPPQPPADVVQMTVDIPVTLLGPGMAGNTVAVWSPNGGPPTQVRLNGRSLQAGTTTLGSIPPSMSDPVVTVEQRRNGTLLVRAEQPPAGRGDRGQQYLMLVRWSGRPTLAEQWSGTAVQRGPRWSR